MCLRAYHGEVHTDRYENFGDCVRVDDIGLSALPFLVAMSFTGEYCGITNTFLFRLGVAEGLLDKSVGQFLIHPKPPKRRDAIVPDPSCFQYVRNPAQKASP